MVNSTIVKLSRVKAPKNKILVKQLKPTVQCLNGIYIPVKRYMHSKLAEIISIGNMCDSNKPNFYYDHNTKSYREFIFHVGDVVDLNFASIDGFTCYDDVLDPKCENPFNVLCVEPESILMKVNNDTE